MEYLDTLSIFTFIAPIAILAIIISIIYKVTRGNGTVWGPNQKKFSSGGQIEVETGETFSLSSKFPFLSEKAIYSGMVNENTFSISMFVHTGRGGLTNYPVFYSKNTSKIKMFGNEYNVVNVSEQKIILQKIS